MSDAPPWLCDLAGIAFNDLGVMALLGPSGINVSTEQGKRVRAMPDPAGLFLAGLSSHIYATGRKLAVGLPPAGRHLPLLLASSAILANALKRSLSRDTLTGGCVLVISSDLDVRSRYCDLFVQREALDAVYVGSRMRPTGERVALRQGENVQRSQGVCFFLPGLVLPERINFRPTFIILDLRYAHWTKRASDIAKWVIEVCRDAGMLALYSLGDSDTIIALSSVGFSDLPLDHAAITACSEQVMKQHAAHESLTIDWRMEDVPSYLDREHEVVEVELAETIEAIFASIGTLLDGQKQKDVPDLNRSRWLLATLTHLPVPLIWYEHAARSLGRSTLHRLIARLGIQGRHNSDLGAVIQTLRMQFEQIYQDLSRLNPRAQALQTLLPHILTSAPHEQVLFLVRDRVMERAVRNWLELEAFPEVDWLSRVMVKACPDYYSVAAHKYDAVLVNGVFPRRYKWMAGASLGARVTFLAYPHEVDVIEHQLRGVYGDQVRTEQAFKRDRAMSQLVSRSISPVNENESPIPRLQLKRPQQKSTKAMSSKSEAKVTIKDIAKLSEAIELSRRAVEKVQEIVPEVKIAPWKEDVSDEEPPEEDTDDIIAGDREESVACIRLHVHSQMLGECVLWLAVDDIVDFVRASLPDDIQRTAPQKLQPGDVLLLMNEGRRTSLFDRFVDLAEEQPSMRYLATYRRTWREAVQRVVARHQDKGRPDYAAMLRSLRAAGATIQSEPAVRSWVQDQVIGPDNVASIAAVGRVSGMEPLVRQAKEFDRVFRDIRGIRQGIGRRLNSAIRRHFKHFAEGVPEASGDTLDRHLGLPLDELLETIDLAEVITVGAHIEKVVSHRVGRLRPIE